MSGNSLFGEFKLYAFFKGALPVEEDDYYWGHVILDLRAAHALGDSETKSEAQELLAKLDTKPDDEAIYELYARWRNELNGARAPFLFPAAVAGLTPIWNTCATSCTSSPPRSTLQP